MTALTSVAGCGRKRSDKSMGTLLDMNSEPAVADLSRQIMSEAKLSEAIQEARQELIRRRQLEVCNNNNNTNVQDRKTSQTPPRTVPQGPCLEHCCP